MNFLFIHNSFPSQFIYAARALAADPSNKVAAIGWEPAGSMRGVKLVKYTVPDGDVSATHPFARRFDFECRRAEQVMYNMVSLQAEGFTPDTIAVHCGWGESLPVRAMFPNARMIVYCEFYYGMEAFDPEHQHFGLDTRVAMLAKNAATLLALADCDCGLSPTHWQRSTYPKEFQSKITVIHEGVDVDHAVPDPNASWRLPSGRVLTRSDEVVTYVTRSLEPMRGYHIFMRALPRILEERPDAQVIIVGGEHRFYEPYPPPRKPWKSMFLDEVADRIDLSRVHFTGWLPQADCFRVMQISSAHVHLTYPFTLPWSPIEALSVGCLMIGSDTPPVREIINGKNGLLVPFFDFDQLAARVIEALAHPQRFADLREQARRTALERYDMERHCLPAVLAFLRGEPFAGR